MGKELRKSYETLKEDFKEITRINQALILKYDIQIDKYLKLQEFRRQDAKRYIAQKDKYEQREMLVNSTISEVEYLKEQLIRKTRIIKKQDRKIQALKTRWNKSKK